MRVLLVHGLNRTPFSMFGLAFALRRAGHHTQFFAYAPLAETLPRIVRRLVAQLHQLARLGRPVGLVGHSLGGLLLRMALSAVPELPVHRLVMLGTPNRPPRMAMLAAQWRAFRWLTRDCGRFLASLEAIPALPDPAVPYTLIAGTGGYRGPWCLFGDEPNDGIVGASEIPIRETDTPVWFPVWHTIMMNDPAVRRTVVAAMIS